MRSVVVILLLAGASGSLLVASPGTTKKQNHDWDAAVEVQGRHYVVRTNTFDTLARDRVATLDRSYPLFEDRFGPLVGRGRLPMRVHLHRTREEYMQQGDGIAGALGHFDPSLDTCVLVWRGGIGEAGWPIAVHEACHQYVRRRHGRIHLPSWYSEGIACWFEGLQTKRTSNRVSRLRFAAAVAALRAGEARIETVLDGRSLVRGGKLQVSGLTPARYYGLAWSLVHFLAGDPRYRRAFRRFELRLFAARPSRANAADLARTILEEECGPLSKVEAEWRKHIKALQPPPMLVAPAVYRWDLASNDAYTRYAALRNLRRAPLAPSIADRLFAAVADSDVVVRTAATRLFANRARADLEWPATMTKTLVGACDHGDRELQRAALGALADPRMVTAVPRLLRQREERDATLYALAVIGDARAFGLLRRGANDLSLSSRTRAACLRSLASDPAARTVLHRATGAPERSVRRVAHAALMRLDTKLATVAAEFAAGAQVIMVSASKQAAELGGTPGLVGIALDPSRDSRDRVNACVLLGRIHAGDSISGLQRLCRPGVDSDVRLAALRALVRITGKTRGYRLAQSARERERAFRAWATAES